ncbi:MAG: hypothetical protein MKZ67_12535, partial [Acidimicrobiales bacterium]|nr:hypothetical protein [Acidimicrobiales bacterium]
MIPALNWVRWQKQRNLVKLGILALVLGAILCALLLWERFFNSRQRVPLLRSDSVGALGTTSRLSSRIPALNFLAAEISLQLELGGVADPEGAHVPGPINKIADYPSRLAPPVENQSPRPDALGGLRTILDERDLKLC